MFEGFIRWVRDEDGDIGLSFAWGLVTLIKYKDRTVWAFFQRFQPAGRWQGYAGTAR